MTKCQLIHCEKASRFAPAVRRELANKALRVIETRSLAGCEAALSESPESLVVIEATASNLAAVVDFLKRLRDRYPDAAAVAVLAIDASASNTVASDAAAPESVAADLLLAEAGALGVFRSLLDAAAIARLAERKFQFASTYDVSLPEFVAARLPWPLHATP